MKLKKCILVLLTGICLMSCSNESKDISPDESGITEDSYTDLISDKAETTNTYVSTSIPDPNITTINFTPVNISASEMPEYEVIEIERLDNRNYDPERSIFWEKVMHNEHPDSFVLHDGNISLAIVYDSAEEAYYVTDVSFNGVCWSLPERIMFLERTFQFERTGDAMILGYSSYGYMGWHERFVWYYINSDGIWELINTPEDDGVEYDFYVKEDRVIYDKTNTDYIIAVQSIVYMVEAYTDDNQFYFEYGILEIDDKSLTYKLSEYYTINDWYLSALDSIYLYEYGEKYKCESVGEFFEMLKKEWEIE